jgi:uncharacterized protein YneF (UPF0154 family)
MPLEPVSRIILVVALVLLIAAGWFCVRRQMK